MNGEKEERKQETKKTVWWIGGEGRTKLKLK